MRKFCRHAKNRNAGAGDGRTARFATFGRLAAAPRVAAPTARRTLRRVSDLLLLGVFATHLPFFVWRYRATRELRYAATSFTFALLVVTYALRLYAPEVQVAGVSLHESVHTLALIAAALSVSLLVHRLVTARCGSREG